MAALKTFDPPLGALKGRQITGAGRRGKYLTIAFDDLFLVSHLSLGGWLRWVAGATTRKPVLKGPIVAEFRFDSGSLDFTEHSKDKRLALWVVRDLGDVPQIVSLGPEALDPALDEAAFAALMRSRPGTVKAVLADQHVIAGIGNAYSDEILHAAQLSPFLKTSVMTDQQSATLYRCMREVLTETLDRSAGMAASALKKDKKSNYRVHARTGEPCPACGDTIREVWLGHRSFQYCPHCQTGGKVYKDRRMSRLLR